MPSAAGWSYRRGGSPAIVETCEVQGCAVALPPHFHDEDQVTLVLSGRRRFVVAGAAVALCVGDAVVLPAGCVHASLPEPGGVLCRNLYLPAGSVAAAGFDAALALWRGIGGRDASAFVGLDACPSATEPALPRLFLRCGETVAGAAARTRMSREGFSRKFVRQHGLPPRTYGTLSRLNRARALLRAGEAPAAVAAAAGFADQSHLGREFRRAFGVTPGRFRDSASQTFQTAGRAAG